MGSKLYKFITFLGVLTTITCVQKVAGQKFDNGKSNDEGEITMALTPSDKNSIFDDRAKYVFEVKNTTAADEVGKITYNVTTITGKMLKQDSLQVIISKKSTKRYNFKIPETKSGFYRVNFMLNVTDYDDTIHRVFGIKPEQLSSSYRKPADFDAYWQKAKADLAKVRPDFETTFMPGLSTEKCNVFLIEMHSLDNVIIRGWLTEPVIKNKKGKYAVILALPGYQVPLSPILGQDPDVAFITLNVRGQGNSRDDINTRHDEFIIHHIEDKNKYVMRGVVMDCIRAMDYIYSRPEFKHDKVFVKGGSMGGFLAIASASLDKRVNLCSAQSPIFADIRSLVNEVDFPAISIKKYIETQPGLKMEQVLNTLDYFDVKNFAPNITCKLLMSVGLLDTYVYPNNEYIVFNSITTNKRLMVYKDLGHEVSPKYIDLELHWMHDEFGLYN